MGEGESGQEGRHSEGEGVGSEEGRRRRIWGKECVDPKVVGGGGGRGRGIGVDGGDLWRCNARGREKGKKKEEEGIIRSHQATRRFQLPGSELSGKAGREVLEVLVSEPKGSPDLTPLGVVNGFPSLS